MNHNDNNYMSDSLIDNIYGNHDNEYNDHTNIYSNQQ
jgi:hypothetical protein